MNIQWKKDASICAIYATGLEFALLSPQNEQLAPFAFCKDFTVLTLWGYLNSQKINIYGFKYDPEKDAPVDLTRTKVLIRNERDKEFAKHAASALAFVNLLSADFGIANATLEETAKKSVFLLSAPSDWQHAPPMLSLLMLTIRVGLKFSGNTTWQLHVRDMVVGRIPGYNTTQHDGNYLKIVSPKLPVLGFKWRSLFDESQSQNFKLTYVKKPKFIVNDCHQITNVIEAIGIVNYCDNFRHMSLLVRQQEISR